MAVGTVDECAMVEVVCARREDKEPEAGINVRYNAMPVYFIQVLTSGQQCHGQLPHSSTLGHKYTVYPPGCDIPFSPEKALEECLFMADAIEQSIESLGLEVRRSLMRHSSWVRSLGR